MKKFFLLIFLVLFLACGDKTTAPVTSVSNACLNGAPDWVMGDVQGGVSGVGTAKIGNAGIAFARNIAQAGGRDQIALSIETKVKTMVKNFVQETGLGDDSVVDRVAATVSKQTANQTLNGTKQKAMWSSPCNELYVLMVIDDSIVKATVKQNVTSSYKNEQAQWQQFQAQKAQDELDAAIQANF